jgi:hypothetical protein
MEETKSNILNGKYEISIMLKEGRMSHWISNFSIKDNINKIIVIDLMNTNWDLCGKVEENNILKLKLRKYPIGNQKHEVKVNLEKGVFEYQNTEYQIAHFKEVLDKNTIQNN